jgi:hypothetical protein
MVAAPLAPPRNGARRSSTSVALGSSGTIGSTSKIRKSRTLTCLSTLIEPAHARVSSKGQNPNGLTGFDVKETFASSQWTPQLGGKPAYERRRVKGRSPPQTRHSVASALSWTNDIEIHCVRQRRAPPGAAHRQIRQPRRRRVRRGGAEPDADAGAIIGRLIRNGHPSATPASRMPSYMRSRPAR